MKKHLILSLALVFGLLGILRVLASRVPDNQDESAITLSLQLNNNDSVAIKAVANMLTSMRTNSAQEIDSVGVDKVQNSVPPKPVGINGAYHYSIFIKRNNAVAIGFDNYFELNNFQSFKDEYLDQDQNDKANLVLFVNGKPLPNIKMQFFNETEGTINFIWDRGDSLTKSMTNGYIAKFHFKIKNPTLGFGYYNTKQKQWVQVASKTIGTLDVLKPYTMVLVGFWLLFMIFFFLRLGQNTNLLKTGVDKSSPYSLALTQFAFWTVIIFSSYFYLWVVDLDLDKIPDSSLVLLGITAATTATSRTVDLKDAQRARKQSSKQFLNDLLTEGDRGYSVHRCQLVLVTLMFGVFYLFEVVRLQALPDFDNSLLWLIGISSGTFVGIKSVEGLKGGGTPATTNQAPQNEQSTNSNTTAI